MGKWACPRPAALSLSALPFGHGCGQGRGLCPLTLFTLCLQDLFKAFARHLSHLLAQKPSPGRSGECLHHQARRPLGGSAGRRLALTPPHPESVVKEEAQNLIKQFFHGRARCESKADWHGLCAPQS